MSEVFLIDANILITPYEQYYPFDFAQTFWQQMGVHIRSGNIAILDMVRDEIYKGQDDLANWLQELHIANMISHKDQDVIVNYSQIIQYLQNSNFYKESAMQEWANGSVADAWLIAAAMKYGYTLVTFEKSNMGLNATSPSKKAKLPNVATYFNVKTVDLFYLMRQLRIAL